MKIIDLKINKKIIQNLLNEGYKDLTEIQQETIFKILELKNIFALAQTGSGKTAAFLVPIIEMISHNRNEKALIISPTRDLVDQIHDNAIKYAKFLGIKTVKIVGASSYNMQIKFLNENPNIIVATPGRIIDLQKRGNLDLSQIKYLVLDEADQMLDMGFINDIKYINSKMINKKQTLLFSATLSDDIKKVVNNVMENYEFIKVKNKFDIKEAIDQKIYVVRFQNKVKLLLDILGDSNRTNDQCIIFTRTKIEASEIAKILKSKKLNAEALHSDRSQQTRTKVLKDFRNYEIQYLVATNVAARGIDISNLPLVINFDIPEQKEIYVHRIGRTARAGKTGEAITFCTPNQKYEIKELENIVKTKITIIEIDKYLKYDDNAPQLNIKKTSSKSKKHHTKKFNHSSNKNKTSHSRLKNNLNKRKK